MSWLADGLTAGAHPAGRRLRLGRAQPPRRRGRAAGPRGRRGPRRAGPRGGPAAGPRTRAGRPHRRSSPATVPSPVPTRSTRWWRSAPARSGVPTSRTRSHSPTPLRCRGCVTASGAAAGCVYGEGIWTRSPTPEAIAPLAGREDEFVSLAELVDLAVGARVRPGRRTGGEPRGVGRLRVRLHRAATPPGWPRTSPTTRTRPRCAAAREAAARRLLPGLPRRPRAGVPPAARCVGVATIARVTSLRRLVPLVLVPLLALARRAAAATTDDAQGSAKAQCTYTEGRRRPRRRSTCPPGTRRPRTPDEVTIATNRGRHQGRASTPTRRRAR